MTMLRICRYCWE